MNIDDAQRFAEQWVADWNSHDLDRIMRPYAEDMTFRSPVAARIVPDSGGVIRGRGALRAYWAEALRRSPDLRFELLGVYASTDTIVINYRKQTGQRSCEVLTFADGVIVSGTGAHGPTPA